MVPVLDPFSDTVAEVPFSVKVGLEYTKSVFWIICPVVPLKVDTALLVDETGPTTMLDEVLGSVIVMSLPVEFEVAMIVFPVLEPLITNVADVPLSVKLGLVYDSVLLFWRTCPDVPLYEARDDEVDDTGPTTSPPVAAGRLHTYDVPDELFVSRVVVPAPVPFITIPASTPFSVKVGLEYTKSVF